jgi:hypothetical protein
MSVLKVRGDLIIEELSAEVVAKNIARWTGEVYDAVPRGPEIQPDCEEWNLPLYRNVIFRRSNVLRKIRIWSCWSSGIMIFDTRIHWASRG